jgi:outer membrane protein assembly factor BamB
VRTSRIAFLSCVLIVLAVVGCGSGDGQTESSSPPSPIVATASTTPGSAPASSGAQDWLAYHRTGARTGVATGSPAAGTLSIAWTQRLDGAVYGQPLVLGDLVIAATEGDTVYGLDRATGHVRWHLHVGTPVPLADLPCGSIDPLGITGTMVYDPANGLVYAVAETTGYYHVLVGVDVADGTLRVRRNIPTPDGNPRYDQQRAALTLQDGRVYTAFGGLNGDCGPYQGSVVSVPASGQGALASYRVPTAREGGIWAPGGPVTGPDGTLYVGVGNGASTGPPFDHSDSVTALSPGLRRTGFFAPTTWPDDNANDLDLGSMSPALLSDGMILAVGKRGTGYLLRASDLGGVGGEVDQAPVCPAFGGAAVNGTVAYVPCEGGGMAAVDTAAGRIRIRWRGPAGAEGSPALGGGAVWVADWNAGILYQLDPVNGHVRHKIGLGSALPHFASPSLSGSLALIGTTSGVVAVRGV